jgi:hypothetical protein
VKEGKGKPWIQKRWTHICPQQRMIYSPKDGTAPQIKWGAYKHTMEKKERSIKKSTEQKEEDKDNDIDNLSTFEVTPYYEKSTILVSITVLKNN